MLAAIVVLPLFTGCPRSIPVTDPFATPADEPMKRKPCRRSRGMAAAGLVTQYASSRSRERSQVTARGLKLRKGELMQAVAVWVLKETVQNSRHLEQRVSPDNRGVLRDCQLAGLAHRRRTRPPQAALRPIQTRSVKPYTPSKCEKCGLRPCRNGSQRPALRRPISRRAGFGRTASHQPRGQR